MKNRIAWSLFFWLTLFYTQLSAQQDTSKIERIYIKIEIKGLACPYCAYGMEKELLKVAGVDNVDIELKEGMAYISTPISQKPTREDLKKIIEDAGFTGGEIEYSNNVFERPSKSQ